MMTEHVKQYAFPCKQMLQFSMFHPQFRFAPHHQAKPEEHIQAAAVEYGISICPFFDSKGFAEVGTRPVEVQAPIKVRKRRVR